MSFLHDKQTRAYCIFIIFLLLLVPLAGMYLFDRQAEVTRELFLAHDSAVASSLLAQGISKEIAAVALTNTEKNSAGSDFLSEIGLSKNTDANRLSYLFSFKKALLPSLWGSIILWAAFMLAGTVIFLQGRERLYRNCESIIQDYIDGNYTVRLSQAKEGGVYQMLAAVEQLAAILQAKNDADQKTKVFLKNTISDISHQLKTPLSALMMYQEIIESEPDNPDTVKAFSAKIGAALKRMEQLIQSMLKITRLDTGSIVFEKENYSIANLIADGISELTTRAELENKEIVIEGDADGRLFCDTEWTSEAIGNIVKNALDHTGRGGRIRISWERTPVMVRICIADNGHGIAPEDIHHIFKRFYRSKNTLETQGIGLGLPLAKAIVEGQGGTISVQSECGKGTAFSLSFLTES